jgi:uncharacterized protein DUF4349
VSCKGRNLLVVAGLVVAIAAASCSGSDSGSNGGAGAEGSAGEGGKRALSGNDYGGGHTVADTSTGELQPIADAALPPVGPSVIKTADVSLRVGSLEESTRALVAVARDNGGFVLSTSVQDGSGDRGTVIMRVPAERFEAALADAEATGDVTREQVAGEDVGQEFVDLAARLRNFEAQESVLLRLMSRSTSVADTLRVQRELQDVQLEIERLRGRIRYLRDQTDLSTLTVDIAERERTVAAPSTIARAWDRAVDTFNAIVSGIVVGLGVVIPIGVLALLLLLLAKAVRSRWPSWGPGES